MDETQVRSTEGWPLPRYGENHLQNTVTINETGLKHFILHCELKSNFDNNYFLVLKDLLVFHHQPTKYQTLVSFPLSLCHSSPTLLKFMKLVPRAESIILLSWREDNELPAILDPNCWWYKMLWLIFAYINTGLAPAVRKLQSLTLTLTGTTDCSIFLTRILLNILISNQRMYWSNWSKVKVSWNHFLLLYN